MRVINGSAWNDTSVRSTATPGGTSSHGVATSGGGTVPDIPLNTLAGSRGEAKIHVEETVVTLRDPVTEPDEGYDKGGSGFAR